ncbi:hypothetical protein BVRB_002800 [Beta vulgaris subsp. vulgaris]|uniref:Uncharacterized protein n=1 Tax=Beta vulgaris subsp. vulgaris TaxID=3555 RepID=A0A0J8B4Z3_BETVV|nr:hypothetical protein BVRB_002800 [Beta vulgaris subsp. vulgaris]
MAGIMSNLVAKALSSLGQSAFKEAASWWGARDDLKKLENSMRMIQARVRDAEKYQEDEGSDAVKEWLRRLNLVLYQADDLFDHILTVDSRKQRRRRNKEVWFLSTRLSRPPCLNWKMAREIKCIKEQLDDLKSDMTGLNLRSKAPQSLRNSRMLRSLLFFPSSAGSEVFLITRFQSLRVLSLKKMRIVTIPDSIGKLIHLRYLNLHKSDIECLPQPISRLENLQTLKLRKCRKLKELPRDFTEMPNLKHLVIANSGLTELPSEFGTMTSLQELDEFIVGERNGIDSVPALNLMRNLHIKFRKWRNGVVLEAQRATLMYSKRLSYLTLDWNLEGEEATPSEMVAMLTHLQLPPNIKYLHICFYRGDKMPCKWLDGLSRLVSIYIIGCDNCRVLPHLSQLPHLKDLHLEGLNALEYVEDEDDIWVSGKCGYGYATNYFPTLEALKLDELPRLKQWTRPLRIGGERQQQRHQLLFRCLLQITVKGCQQLVWMPLALKLESLEVSRGNGRLFKSNVESINDEEGSSTLYTSLKNLKIDESNNALEFLSISSRLCNLETLTIQKCDKLMSLEIECPSSIRNINIIWCTKFSNISNIVKGDFPFLETLVIWNNSEVLEEEEEGKATTTIRNWQGLTSVRHLDLWDLKKLPPGIACLTKLQFLEIGNVENLTALPEQLGNLTLLSELSILKCPKLKLLPLSLQGLTSLQTLFIRDCPYLEERYKKPYGQDCHLLQHIPHLDV